MDAPDGGSPSSSQALHSGVAPEDPPTTEMRDGRKRKEKRRAGSPLEEVQ